jgi:hypothetical protein
MHIEPTTTTNKNPSALEHITEAEYRGTTGGDDA